MAPKFQIKVFQLSKFVKISSKGNFGENKYLDIIMKNDTQNKCKFQILYFLNLIEIIIIIPAWIIKKEGQIHHWIRPARERAFEKIGPRTLEIYKDFYYSLEVDGVLNTKKIYYLPL